MAACMIAKGLVCDPVVIFAFRNAIPSTALQSDTTSACAIPERSRIISVAVRYRIFGLITGLLGLENAWNSLLKGTPCLRRSRNGTWKAIAGLAGRQRYS